MRGLYNNGWFDGRITYYNKKLTEYVILYEDNTSDYVKLADFDGVELMFIT